MKARTIVFIVTLTAAMHIHAQQVLRVSDSTKMPFMELEEVDIRSSRENIKIQELPISVTSISAKRIESDQVNATADLSSRVPNLFMPDYGSRLTSPIYIRGIGSRINAPSVGLYVDGVPYFEKSAFNFEFFDIERIEVLRGPQGTLYGRNTMGGIINVYTQKPGQYPKTDINLYGGNYYFMKAHIGHDQPLGDHLSLGLDGLFIHHDGFYNNDYTGDKVDELDSYSGRVRLVYDPVSPWEAEYTMNMEISRQGGYPYALIGNVDKASEPISYNRYSYYDRDLISNNFRLRYKKEKMEFNSITSYQFLDGYQEIDQDFTPATLLFVTQDEAIHMLSQEVNLKNKIGNYKAVSGMFGFLQYGDKKVDVAFGEDGINAFNLPGPTQRVKFYDQLTRGSAVFHQSTWNNLLVQGLSFSFGMRVDYEKAILKYKYDLIINDKEIPKTTFDHSLEFFEVLPRASVAYKINEDMSTYFTVSKGYKTGGFNSTFERKEDRTFDPEKSWNYEAGLKSKWMEKRLMTNFSVFYIDWYDQQIYQPVPSGQGSMLKNAGHSESKGLELEISALPARNLQSYASFGYVDARFLDYKKDSATDFSGNRIPYIPEFTFSIGGNYKFYLDSKLLESVRVNINYQGIGSHYWNEDNTVKQNYYGLLNSQIGFATPWFEVGFWVKIFWGLIIPLSISKHWGINICKEENQPVSESSYLPVFN
ncbi:MAG: TonB-dependent receptor [Bacteroidota bacterium]|nr:TonB-dependent receptor [Bacteroidota bacterium]